MSVYSPEIFGPEGITALEGVAAFLVVAALNFYQRQAIRERDEGRCQVPVAHYCDIRERRGEVDHILPQRWGQKRLHMTENQLDQPENLYYACHYWHQNIRHPDMREARMAYRQGDRQAYKRVFARRDELLSRGEKYWYSAYDSILKKIAVERTAQARAHGWHWPK